MEENFEMVKIFIQILAAAVGTFGFCLTFHIDKKQLWVPTLGGGLCWALYLFIEDVMGLPLFAATFLTALLIGIYGEIMAHLRAVPTTVYFIPSCIPLIPGGNLYFMLTGLLDSDYAKASQNAEQLVLYTLGIASGLAVTIELDHIRRVLAGR